MSASSEDEGISLTTETFTALQEYYSEQEERDARRLAVDNFNEEELSTSNCNEVVSEDWQLSQFWYTEETAASLAKEAIRIAKSDGMVACISCPTLYIAIKKYFPENKNVYLFEYDQRFQKIARDKFVFYDFNAPVDVPRDFRDQFSVVIADPPFLSDECITKTAITVKYLGKDKIIFCTGKKMTDMCDRLMSLKVRKFAPKHKNNLANEFCCLTNYEEFDEHMPS
ncbi:EEF1A lysine methyltransferase 1 [Lepeophtheirus salmonis]|uniref:EEF1A lysine methyltransferase 1 n=1 Tax=Lepeophtheirus salmonis TaxID=72036 RepID=UPI001AE30BF3|nr:EEF1A lysine methyltransferase 1-like [Lepeophtheirus salmonis]